jgi:carboxymethylenebutenolidase
MADEQRQRVVYDGEAAPVQAYLARPKTREPRPAVIVIHEIYGLTEHIEDVADRFAGEGYVAFAPDLFCRPGLAEVMTPSNIQETMQFMSSVDRGRLVDAAYRQEAMAQLPPEQRERVQQVLPLILGGLPKDSLTRDLVRAVDYLGAQRFVRADRIGSVGFCFGGGMSINLACRTQLAASVVFYGENPSPIELVERIAGPVLGLYGAEDLRVNARLDELVKAMVAYKKDFEMRIYPGAGHAFFNDTRATVYREHAARDAWDRVLRFYARTLAGA